MSDDKARIDLFKNMKSGREEFPHFWSSLEDSRDKGYVLAANRQPTLFIRLFTQPYPTEEHTE
jgi:hypothetical protein